MWKICGRHYVCIRSHTYKIALKFISIRLLRTNKHNQLYIKCYRVLSSCLFTYVINYYKRAYDEDYSKRLGDGYALFRLMYDNETRLNYINYERMTKTLNVCSHSRMPQRRKLEIYGSQIALNEWNV